MQLVLSTVIHLGWILMPEPLYSPDLAPSEFFPFDRLKTFLRGKTFDFYEKLLLEVRNWFKEQDIVLYQSAFVRWKKRLEKLYRF